jgi:thiamine-phosphate pyrophosphorylase
MLWRHTHPRHCRALPRLWLMTDERMGDALLPAVWALPAHSGIVFRHYHTAAKARRRLFQKVRRVARARGHLLFLAGTAREARGWGADGHHGRSPRAPGRPMTAPVHSLREMIAARRLRADLVLVSPVFATRSHPGQKTLGRIGFFRLARTAPCPVIALGGMNRRRFRSLASFGAYGWAAIDTLTPELTTLGVARTRPFGMIRPTSGRD